MVAHIYNLQWLNGTVLITALTLDGPLCLQTAGA